MKRDTLGTLRARIAALEFERDQAISRAELAEEKLALAMDLTREWQRRAEVAEAALRPFAKYINARLAIFSEMSRNAYPNLLLSHGSSVTADIHREDWERARVVVEGKTNAK